MQKVTMFVSRRAVIFAGLIAIAGLSAGRANAAAVFLWVTDGTDLLGYSSTGALQTTTAAPTGGNYFSVSTYGTGTSQFVLVSDPAKHTLTEYSYNGSQTGALTAVGTTFTVPGDTVGGSIDPQGIAIDGSGNLWTTSANGNITEYCGIAGGCNSTSDPTGYAGKTTAAGGVIQTVTLPTADGDPRDVMVDAHTSTTTIYLTTSSYGADANGNVFDFALGTTGAAGTVAKYASLTSSTSGGVETGQLRGITYDEAGDIFYADSTWGPDVTGTGNTDGYICEAAACSPEQSTLNTPNEIEVGPGTASSGSRTSSCDVVYATSYAEGTVTEYDTGIETNGTASSSTCGTLGGGSTNFLTLGTGLNAYGVALAVGTGVTNDVIAGPEGLFLAPVASTPEPGTFALMIGALLLAFGIVIRAQRRQLQ
jgi:hypothetical protein